MLELKKLPASFKLVIWEKFRDGIISWGVITPITFPVLIQIRTWLVLLLQHLGTDSVRSETGKNVDNFSSLTEAKVDIFNDLQVNLGNNVLQNSQWSSLWNRQKWATPSHTTATTDADASVFVCSAAFSDHYRNQAQAPVLLRFKHLTKQSTSVKSPGLYSYAINGSFCLRERASFSKTAKLVHGLRKAIRFSWKHLKTPSNWALCWELVAKLLFSGSKMNIQAQLSWMCTSTYQ